MLDTLTIKQIQDNPILVVCQHCKWSGDIRECPTRLVSYMDFGGELDYEKEPVCLQCGNPNLE